MKSYKNFWINLNHFPRLFLIEIKILEMIKKIIIYHIFSGVGN